MKPVKTKAKSRAWACVLQAEQHASRAMARRIRKSVWRFIRRSLAMDARRTRARRDVWPDERP